LGGIWNLGEVRFGREEREVKRERWGGRKREGGKSRRGEGGGG